MSNLDGTKSPLECIQDATETFRERAAVYGDNYLRFGHVMQALFPDGVTINNADDWNRFGIIIQKVSKLSRYATNPYCGHIDSTHDDGVYSFMLESLDRAAEAKRSDTDGII
jgi:hypothetical protein